MVSAAESPGALAGPVLVAAKLHVPALRAGMVSRGELVGRVAGAGDCKLVLVCAPAGWGKTSVLSQWHSAEPGVLAWVSLDPGDDDRVRFWSYVIGAVRTVAPEVGDGGAGGAAQCSRRPSQRGSAVAAQRAGRDRAPPGAGAG